MPKTARTCVLGLVGATALALSACSASSSEPGGERGPNEPVTIEYWHINTEAFGAAAVEELVAEFNNMNSDVRVRARFHDGYSNLVSALQAAVAAGTPPDLAQIGYSRNRHIAENFPYVSMSDLGVNTGSYSEATLALGEIDGEQVAMPYGLSVLLVYYNEDLLADAGIDASSLATWDDWISAAQTFRQQTGRELINFQQFAGDNFIPQAMIASNGGDVLDCVDGRAVAAFDSDEGIEAVGLMGSLVDLGLATNLTSDQALQAFLGGQTATLITSSASRANLESQAGFELGAASFPRFGVKPLRLPAGGNNLFAFPETDSERAATREFIEFLTTDPDSIETWVVGTGYLSPLEGAAEGYTNSNPLQAIAAESAKYLTPWVSFPGPGGLQASQIMYDATQAVMGGTASAREALVDAAQQINGQIGEESCG